MNKQHSISNTAAARQVKEDAAVSRSDPEKVLGSAWNNLSSCRNFWPVQFVVVADVRRHESKFLIANSATRRGRVSRSKARCWSVAMCAGSPQRHRHSSNGSDHRLLAIPIGGTWLAQCCARESRRSLGQLGWLLQ